MAMQDSFFGFVIVRDAFVIYLGAILADIGKGLDRAPPVRFILEHIPWGSSVSV